MGSRDQSDVMTCRNWRSGTCPKSDPVILQEDSQHIQMGCKTCRGGWVVSMPEGKAKARYENRLTEIRKRMLMEKAYEQRTRYFT